MNPEAWNCRATDFGSEALKLDLSGPVDVSSAGSMIEYIRELVHDKQFSRLYVDLKNVTRFDDYGAAVLMELRDMAKEARSLFFLSNLSDNIRNMLELYGFDSQKSAVSLTKIEKPNIFLRLGEATCKLGSDFMFMVSFIGDICISFLSVFFKPKSLRLDDTLLCMQRTGVDALPIVALISFLLGLIMAFMSSVQLQQFGANIYVASLVSLSMARELGPIMTSIIVAGRSGSAFAAEIGTMKISEEIDALFTMGFDPVKFLVVPKIIAAAVVVPVLTLFSNLFANAGGMLVGVFMLDLTSSAYISQAAKTLTLFDIFWGVFKSLFFGLLIAWIGCFRGFQVSGGAASVGQATTSAVVTSIFLIILTDSIFAVLLRYLG